MKLLARLRFPWATLAVVVGALFALSTEVRTLRGMGDCFVGCRSCDLSIWRALAMKLKDPDLFARDQLFAMQMPVFPTAFATLLNVLQGIVGDPYVAEAVLAVALAAIFLTGVALLAARLTRDDGTAAIMVLLTVVSSRMQLSEGVYWGLPNLKPMGLVQTVMPLLLWVLVGAMRQGRHPAWFAVPAALAVYFHPPAGLALLGSGLLLYVLAGDATSSALWDRRRWLRAIVAGLLATAVLLPLVAARVGAAIDPGPPLDILKDRAAYALFPSIPTVGNFLSHMLFPLLLALVCAPFVGRTLQSLERRFLVALILISAGITSLGALAYLNTGLAKFLLPTASLLAYIPIFIVLASAARALPALRVPARVAVAAGLLIVVLRIDTTLMDQVQPRLFAALQNLRQPAAAEVAPVLAAADSPAGPQRYDDTSCTIADAGRWIDANTPRSSLIVVPPRDVNSGFRVVSRRSLVVVDKDGGNSKYSKSIATEWTERTRAIDAAYAAGTWEALDAAAQSFGAELVLVPATTRVPTAAVLHANEEWVVARSGAEQR